MKRRKKLIANAGHAHLQSRTKTTLNSKLCKRAFPPTHEKMHDLLTCAKRHGATIISEKMPHERLAQTRYQGINFDETIQLPLLVDNLIHDHAE